MSAAARGVRVLAVDAAAGRPLRMAVLRPHEPPERRMYAREDDAATLHVAAVGDDGSVLAVGSAMSEPHPRQPHEGDWRVRGMATVAELRGQGLGAIVLERLEREARRRGARRFWCNARSGARCFYERAGYGVEGERFEIDEIGPHYLMSKQSR